MRCCSKSEQRLLVPLAALALAIGFAAALAPPAAGQRLDCPATPLEGRIEGADAAFVGRLLSERPATDGARRLYRFVVDQRVKGPIGREVELEAARLTDAEGTPLLRDVAVGVLATRDGAAWVTASCSLTDAGALLSTADEPKGGAIKIVIGLVILALVLAYSFRRLRRRSVAAERPPAGGPVERREP
jgi:hypothetical protein